jgi:hypothetical protein
VTKPLIPPTDNSAEVVEFISPSTAWTLSDVIAVGSPDPDGDVELVLENGRRVALLRPSPATLDYLRALIHDQLDDTQRTA